MIVLVDTSVWIRFLSNRAPYAAELDALLSRDEVSGHDFVYGELLIGDKGGRKQLLADYEPMHQAPVVPRRDLVEFVRDRRLHGRGIGWIDAHLLGSALVGRLSYNVPPHWPSQVAVQEGAMTHTRRPGSWILVVLLFGVVAGCSRAGVPTAPDEAAATGSTASTAGAELNHQIAEVRRVTAQYHNLDKAIAAGYEPISPCVESPAGGMGIHYGNQALINNPSINHLEPEVLLYLPDERGRLRLVAVEYIVPEPIWPGGAANPPSLFGHTFHPGPPPLLILHAWIWHHNPAGMFEDWNPRVSCPS